MNWNDEPNKPAKQNIITKKNVVRWILGFLVLVYAMFVFKHDASKAIDATVVQVTDNNIEVKLLENDDDTIYKIKVDKKVEVESGDEIKVIHKFGKYTVYNNTKTVIKIIVLLVIAGTLLPDWLYINRHYYNEDEHKF